MFAGSRGRQSKISLSTSGGSRDDWEGSEPDISSASSAERGANKVSSNDKKGSISLVPCQSGNSHRVIGELTLRAPKRQYWRS